jgi:hypothetical protein
VNVEPASISPLNPGYTNFSHHYPVSNNRHHLNQKSVNTQREHFSNNMWKSYFGIAPAQPAQALPTVPPNTPSSDPIPSKADRQQTTVAIEKLVKQYYAHDVTSLCPRRREAERLRGQYDYHLDEEVQGSHGLFERCNSWPESGEKGDFVRSKG